MSKLYNDFKQYQFSTWERIIIKFELITFPIVCVIEVYYC